MPISSTGNADVMNSCAKMKNQDGRGGLGGERNQKGAGLHGAGLHVCMGKNVRTAETAVEVAEAKLG